MEVQYKGNGGIESGRDQNEMAVANRRKMSGSAIVLRFFALALSLAAAVVLGVDKQTKTVPVTLIATLPPLNVPFDAKYHYMSAFVFFVAANSIACAHAAISLLLILGSRDGNKGIALMVIFFDLVMVALLFSSLGAAVAIGVMGYNGNSHVRWNKVCNVFDRFCDQTTVSFGFSGASAIAFFLLVVLAILNPHKKP